ncbi:MAG: hypothetical protein DMG41_11330 [Acidobacteria bacterium]|nr:MAG: hypothetical protein AUH13_03460 [Acidobacteria bacterium 13_2_20CM_58_27]PYT88624.1 MAG: hypothetical protein DMG41_11330 [Acidobacteriota bacterium]
MGRARAFAGPRRGFRPHHGFCRFLLVLMAPFLAWAAGCSKAPPGRLSVARIHAITSELSEAAQSAAPMGSQIHITLGASDKSPQAPDQLDITLFSDKPSSTRSDAAKVERSLDAAATRNGLARHPLPCREGICFYYARSSARTHVVHLHVRPASEQKMVESGHPSSLPKLAIILDDLGSDRRVAQEIFGLPYPLTLSILPNHQHSEEIAEEAERRGYQVMLHLPMQAVASERPEAQELRPGMPAREVSKLVTQFLHNVPGAVGANNHQGSEATSDLALMGELMPVLRGRHLFYIDSRTTAATVAYETAQRSQVRSAFRNVPFLDDVEEVAAVRKQLELALRGAREKGGAVAIGHPHSATLEALRDVLPKAQEQGVRLAFASELVH